MEGAIETPLLRENRLYQADHLLRDYAFDPGELVYSRDGNLPLAKDPKLSWALAHPERFPVEASTADREALLRVPGLGPRTVDRILAVRLNAANLDSTAFVAWECSPRGPPGSWRGTAGPRDPAIQETLFRPRTFPARHASTGSRPAPSADRKTGNGSGAPLPSR